MALQAPIGNLLAIFETNIRKDGPNKEEGPAFRRSRSSEVDMTALEAKHAHPRPSSKQHQLALQSQKGNRGGMSSDDDYTKQQQRQRALVKAKVKEFEQHKANFIYASSDHDKECLVKNTVKMMEGRHRRQGSLTNSTVPATMMTESTVEKHKKVFDRSHKSKNSHRRSLMGPGVASALAKYDTSDDDGPVLDNRRKKKKHRDKKEKKNRSSPAKTTDNGKKVDPQAASVSPQNQQPPDRRYRRSSMGPGIASALAKYDTSDEDEPTPKQPPKEKRRRASATVVATTEQREREDPVSSLPLEKPKRVFQNKLIAPEKEGEDVIPKKSSSPKTIGKVQIPDTLKPRTSTGSETTVIEKKKSDRKKKHSRKGSKHNKSEKVSGKEDKETTDAPSTIIRPLPGKLQVPELFARPKNSSSSKSKSSTRLSSKKLRSKARAKKRFPIPEFKGAKTSNDIEGKSLAEVLRTLTSDPVQDSINQVLDILALQCQKDLPKPSPVTPARRFARRASTGRLYGSDRSLNVENTTQWECKPAHAVQVSVAPNAIATTEEASLSPPKRAARRHSIGSVAVCQGTDESQDFWHTYEELDEETSDSPPKQPIRSNESSSRLDDNSYNDEEQPKQPTKFARRRTVMFDSNVTVWFFTKENPMEHDLQLPQTFVPPVDKPSDAAPKMARRRSSGDNASMKQDQATLLSQLAADVQNDSAPVAPKRHDYDSDCSDDSDETISYYDDDETSVASIVSAPMEERPRRVCFAEDKNEVVYVEKYIKEMENEVILPQAGVIFCASEANSDAPTAPRRRSEKAEEAIASIRASIRGLNESEAEQREAREIDMLPRRPMRRDSLSSMGSCTSSMRRTRSMESLPLRSRRSLLFFNTENESTSQEVPPSFLGKDIAFKEAELAKDAKDIGNQQIEPKLNGKESGVAPKEIVWGGSNHGSPLDFGKDEKDIVLVVFDVNGAFPTRGSQKRTSTAKSDAALVSPSKGDFNPQKPPNTRLQATLKPTPYHFSALSVRPDGWRGYSFKQSPTAKTTKQTNLSANSLRPVRWRGESVKSLSVGVRMDSTRSFTTDDLIEEDEPSNFIYPGVPSMRPGTMRGNSIRNGLSYRMDSARNFVMDDAIDEDEESSHGFLSIPSMRPGTMRGNSIRNGLSYRMDSTRSFTTDDLIHEVEEEGTPSCSQAGQFSAFAMRPGAFRGDSTRSMASHRLDSTRSFTTDDLIQVEEEDAPSPTQTGRFSAFAMRPGGFRGNSTRNMASYRMDSTRSFTTDDIIFEGGNVSSSPQKGQFSAFAMRPGGFRGDSFRK
eukprot:scaffold7354_cov95-Amphora_coffeaeformis.AAC.3